MKVDAGAQADAVSLERGELNGHLHEDAERVADGDDEERGVGVYGRDRGIHEEGCDDDDVVRHRGDRGPQIVAVCVQKARHDRRGAVEDELNGEVLEEKRRKCARRLVGVERLCIDDLGGKDHAEDRQRAEEDSYEREQVRCVGVARLGARFLLDRDIDREKRRDEHAAHDELIEHVRQIVRNLIGAREERRAEREGHRPCSQEPGDAGEEYADAHERRRRADGRCLAFGLFADDGDIGRRRGGAYGVARFDARLGWRVRAGARRCGKRLVDACVFAHDGNRRGFAWGRTAHEGLSLATGIELGRLIGAGVLAYDGDAASLACFPGARPYGWRLVCTVGVVLLRGAPMLSSCELV